MSQILGVVNATLLAALAEPNRLRIVGLLGAAPRSVGEIAAALRLRQPQVTKHLQTLERAGVVPVSSQAQTILTVPCAYEALVQKDAAARADAWIQSRM